jgi:hypothetical protein
MPKMSLHDPFGYLKHQLWPKERSVIKVSIWLSTTKSRESPWLICVQVACQILLESSWRELKFFFNLISIGGIHTKLRAFKVTKVLILGISWLQLGNPEIKWHLAVSPMARHIEYYKGEGGGFPQVQAVMNFMGPCLFVGHPGIKSAPTMH